MINKNRNYPTNPLGTIAIFVFSIEAISASSLIALKDHYDLLRIITIFIVVFPSAIAIVFFFFLWLNREALYSPRDYQSDESFLKLSKKLNTLKHAEQVVKSLPQNLNQVLSIIDTLTENGEIRNSIKIGRGYLKLAEKSQKDEDFDFALKIFNHLEKTVAAENNLYYKIPTNIGYIYIETQEFSKATSYLERATELVRVPELYQLVPLAFSILKLEGECENFEKAIQRIKDHPNFDKFEEYYPKRYIELGSYLK